MGTLLPQGVHQCLAYKVQTILFPVSGTGNTIHPVNLQRAISDVIDPLIPCDELLQCLANIK